MLSEQAYEDAVFAVRLAAYERELALIRQKVGAETAEYKKANADKLKDEADYKAKKKKLDDDMAKAEFVIQAFKKVLGQQELDFLAAALGKKSAIYKLALAAQKAAALAEIGIHLQTQIQEAFTTRAKIQGMFPPVSIPLGIAYTALAIGGGVVNAGTASAKIAGFRTGGRTSGGGGTALEVAGLQVAPNGQLLDGEGYAVAGVVHENEYVIPEWMRADPKVAQMEQYLEARRLRGYAQGGATTQSSPAPVGELAGADSGEVAQLLRQLIADNRSHGEKMDTWARELKVVQQLHELDQAYTDWKKVNSGGISG